MSRSRIGLCLLLVCVIAGCAAAEPANRELAKRWLFVWRDMNDPQEVDRTIALFPRAQAAGYNACLFEYSVAPSKVKELNEAAKRYGIALIPILMGGAHDQNYTEGVPAKEVLFVAHGGIARHQPDPPITVPGGDFEEVRGDRFTGWNFQDNEGKSIFADHTVVHGGKTSARMENIGPNHPAGNCRFSQPLTLHPFRQYRISFWVRAEQLRPASAEVKVLSPDAGRAISFGTFNVEPTQDWKHYDIVFNSVNNPEVMLYLGVWGGKSGRLWWDDLTIEEIGLMNVVRRPGCPVTVRGENGVTYEEGRDYEYVKDPNLHIWQQYHEPPVIHLTANTRIEDGQRLRVTYYHPVIVYEERLTSCLSEPKIFEWWREEVKQANDNFHPPAFMMSHDELRVMNWCEACQSRNMTPGQLLADNVHRAAQIIRDLRPDAEIWVWNDMFDPMHNAKDDYYLCNGTLKGSWEGLDPGIGIVTWVNIEDGKNSRFFAERGNKQVLAGYYDGDEDGQAIADWLKDTGGIPGIVGAMYTTWQNKYGAMEAWAKKAWDERPKE